MQKPKNTKKMQNSKAFKVDKLTRNLFVLFDQTRDTMYQAQELELQQHRSNVPQTRILFMLTREERGMTLAEISRWILRNFNSVSTLVNRMEKKGLVQKTKNSHDGKVYITLTNKGHELWNQINERALHLVFSVLSEEEKEQLQSYLMKLRSKARSLLGLDFKPPFLP